MTTLNKQAAAVRTILAAEATLRDCADAEATLCARADFADAILDALDAGVSLDVIVDELLLRDCIGRP